MSDRRFIPLLAYLLAGMILWAAAFTAAYGAAAIVCARGLGDMAVLGIAILPLSLGVITMVALAATGLIAVAAYRRRPNTGDEAELPAFVQTMTLIVALLAIVAIVWNAVPGLFFVSCA
jgi:hypothetical protein